jgi:DNA mismatch repair protein MutL
VVRELLDNAIDAGGREISLYIKGGGIDAIRVVDNGIGMSEEDLRLCWLPHATSKIETEEDLHRITSLGFRGEALSALAFVSRLEILSRTEEENEGHRLIVHGGQLISLEPQGGRPGTVVTAEDLFYALPARRRFLKRPSTETNLCKGMFLEKALPFPDRAFKLFLEDKLTLFLPVSDLRERIASVYPEETHQNFLHEISGTGTGFSLRIIAATPDQYRKDRKHLQLFVNNRRIWDFSLLQAVEYAYSAYIPGGLYPVCYVFLELSPELVDFNIHPAKKEARIRNTEEIRKRISELLTSFLLNNGQRLRGRMPGKEYTASTEKNSLWVEDASNPGGFPFREGYELTSSRLPPGSPFPLEALPDRSSEPPAFKRSFLPQDPFVYKGQVFGLFLLVEWGDRLYLVDQHAAHERFLYDSLAADRVSQPLLVPLEFPVEPEQEGTVTENARDLADMGIRLEKKDSGTWALTGVPPVYKGAEEEIVEFITTHAGTKEVLQQNLFSRIACRKAIKDGGSLDPLSAYEILRYIFTLENPRCPHGRPLWVEITREELFRQVKRIV